MSRAGLHILVRTLDDAEARKTLAEYFESQQAYHTMHSLNFVTSTPPRVEEAIQAAAKAEEYENLLGSLDQWVRDSIAKGQTE